MMASNSSYCESCSEEGTSIAAIRFCLDCEEQLCNECVEYHKKCKATKSHHLIDLASIAKLKIPTITKFCEVHKDVHLDFYCPQHDTECCRVCIPSTHQSCKDVIPLEVASEHIKKSSLFEDTLSEWENILKTLKLLKKNRNDNICELEKSESAICEEVMNWKSNIIKQITTFEEKIKIDLSNVKTRNLDELRKQITEISELHDSVQERGHELEFLKDHGSNNQLFLKLREQGKVVQNVVKRVQEMTTSYKTMHVKFEKSADIDLKSIGSISVCKEATNVPYSLVKLQQAQVQPERVILTFKREITEQLQLTDKRIFSDLAITADDTMFLCNSGVPKIYVYRINLEGMKYINTLSLPSQPCGISILTGTNQAVITLPYQHYVQFINTKSLTLDKTIKVGAYCYGITTTADIIVVGRLKEIIIFKHNGERIRSISLNDQLPHYVVSSLNYNLNTDSIVYRKNGMISNIQVDGTVLYHYAVSAGSGLAVDTQGHIYLSVCDESKIQRLLPDGRFRDVVLTEKDGIEKPYAIAFNENYTKFYVTNNNGLMQIYNCI
ncbi:uncharacterized protein [Mytilus edulis]|uniref:uncharacterized protein n=1 Tax=Mytilus edulis TaxID=6550 RepID=UPI0039EE2473